MRIFVPFKGVLVPIEFELSSKAIYFRSMADKGDPSERISLDVLALLHAQATEGRSHDVSITSNRRNMEEGPDMVDSFRINLRSTPVFQRIFLALANRRELEFFCLKFRRGN